MPLPARLTQPCACGTNRDDHGRCTHCDVASFHPVPGTDCTSCDRLARRCTCCGTIYGSPDAARTCENNDRTREARQRL